MSPIFVLSQDLTGLWEGELLINNDKNQKLKVQLEMQSDEGGKVLAVIYTRGFEDNRILGCDFIMSGVYLKGKLALSLTQLQRNIGFSVIDCLRLKNISAIVSKEDSLLRLTGTWGESSGMESSFTCSKTSDALSESAKDDLNAYIDQVYQHLDQDNYFLPPVSRMAEQVTSIMTDSSEIILEIRAKSLSGSDSIAIYLNGENVLPAHDLAVKPLKLVIRLNEDIPSEILIVNGSHSVKTLDLTALLKIGPGVQKLFELHPSFTKNDAFSVQRERINH
ncbi:MAG: hypothetical protein GC171_12255 [Terrimonas sp.]|nr:hypothetical protein [Terrimonas sp.]